MKNVIKGSPSLLTTVLLVPALSAAIVTQNAQAEESAGTMQDMPMHQGMDHSMHQGMDHEMHQNMDHSMHKGMHGEQTASAPVVSNDRDPHAYSDGLTLSKGPYALPGPRQMKMADEHRFWSVIGDRLEYEPDDETEEDTGLQAAYDYQLQNEEGEPLSPVTGKTESY